MTYPAQYESDVVLRDGSTLRLRPVRSGDREGLLALTKMLHRAGLLSGDFTTTKVADVLWQAGAPSSYELLVVERGWTPKEFERWLVHLARSFLQR